jgi:hypothetical protein
MARPPSILLLLSVGLVLLMPLLLVVVVEAYPHYLLNPEGCVDKKLEVGQGGREGGREGRKGWSVNGC